MKTLWLGSLLVLTLFACGDNNGSPNASPDAGSNTPTPDAPSGPTPPAAGSRVVVVAGDFKTGDPGTLAVVDASSHAVTSFHAPAGAVGNDPQLRHFGSELFIINRADNNITILDDATFALEEQLSTGAGSDPQDLAVVGNKLYVPTLLTSGVTVLTRGSSTTTQIDLSADDPDGDPDCESAITVGTDVYVACDLLSFDAKTMIESPRGPGKLYVIDTTTDTVRTSVTLTTDNPISFLEVIPSGAPHAGDLVVGTVNFADGSGCLERVTPGVTPVADGCVVNNSALAGGYISRVAFEVTAGESLAWFAVPTTFPMAQLRAYNLGTSTLGAVVSAAAEAPNDVVACPSGAVVAADTTKNASGLRVYSDTAELTTALLTISLPPVATHGLVCY